MPASSMEVFRLMEQMHEVVADIAMGHPRHVVCEAITRVAVAIVAGCADDARRADALTTGAAIFMDKANRERSSESVN